MTKVSKMQLESLTDEDLMSLYQSGEYLAFEELYSRHSGKVFEYLKKKVSAETSQDLLQEIFLKIHKAREQYSKQYPFLPWLFTISRNALFDYFKSIKKFSDIFPEQTNDNPQNIELNLAGALKSLPENQRRAIELRYLEEWTFEKIADDIKTTPDNVRQLISRGLKKARNGFKKGTL